MDAVKTDTVASEEDLSELVNSLDDEKKNISSDEEKLELSSEDFPFSLSLRIDDIDDSKDLTKFVKNVERMVRGSTEYRLWLKYIKEVLGYTKCGITDEIEEHVTIEIHHHPFTLFSIIKSEVNKVIASGRNFCTFDIAVRTIELHFKNKIGYIPIVKTLHEKFHNGFFQIPMNIVYGNYDYLVQNNLVFLDGDEQDKIKSRLSIDRNNCGWERNNIWIGSKEEVDQE